MNRREFSTKTRKEALKRQDYFRERFEAIAREPRSKSANFKWIESVVSKTWPPQCIEWPFAKRGNGYGTIIWKYRRTTANRVVCEIAHGAAPNSSMQAAHSCGNRSCCNPAHLRWATVAENHADKIEHGTHLSGDSCPAAKLTEQQVRKVRRYLRKGISRSEIGEMFNVSASTIWMISAGKTWRGVA